MVYEIVLWDNQTKAKHSGYYGPKYTIVAKAKTMDEARRKGVEVLKSVNNNGQRYTVDIERSGSRLCDIIYSNGRGIIAEKGYFTYCSGRSSLLIHKINKDGSID